MKRIAILVLFLTLFSLRAESKHIIDLNTGNGLSSSLINCLFQDSSGDIWIGTENGLNRYNGVRIKVYKAESGKQNTLSDNSIRVIMEDSRGNLIIGTQSGVQIYDRNSDCFSAPLKMDQGKDYRGNVNSIIERSNGEIWVSGNRLMKIVYPDNKEPVLSVIVSQLPNELTGDLVEDESGDIWLTKYNSGIYRLTRDGSFHHYQTELLKGPYNRLSTGPGKAVFAADNHGNLVRFDRSQGVFVKEGNENISDLRINTLLVADDRYTYIGTDGNGVFVKDSSSGTIRHMSTEGMQINMDKAKVHHMLLDKEGNMWIGIYQRGVVMIPPESSSFWYLGRNVAEYDMIGSCSTTSLLVDSNGRLWVGTDNDGIYELDQPFKTRKHYSMEEGMPGTCFSLTEDSEGNIWFGTYSRGVWRINPKTREVRSGSEITGADIDDRSVYAIAEDSRGRIWLGSLGSYICCYDLKSRRISFPDFSNTDLSKWVLDILIIDNTLYAASYDGLFSMDISGDIPVVKQHLLPEKVIYSIKADGGKLYCCTSEGVVTITLSEWNITSYTTLDGLSDNMVHDVRVASPGKIWFSTGAGLSLLDASAGTFTNYYPDDGFMVSEFSWKTSASGDDNLLFFGGSDGVTVFNPSFVQQIQKALPTRIVEIIAENRFIPLNNENCYTLKYNENSCNISFATKDYNVPAGVVFSYSTNGKEWTQLPLGQHNITLSKLTPGRYDLMVRAIDRGKESDPVHVRIKVRHPWWGSLPAKLFYLLLCLSAICIFYILLRRNLENKREIERHTQAEEANEDKVKFFINLSHEIRSPLTLISAPLQSLIENDKDAGRQYTYSIMDKSVKQVLQVVNQMLDIRKMEKGMMALSFSPVNIVEYVSSIVILFKEQAGLKGLNLTFRYDGLKEQEVWIDPNYFSKVIINLLTNAIKYTPEGGSINVTVTSEVKKVKIEVRDNGTGLSDEELKKVFNRFYQAGNAVSGTGIGLNLAKMLTELHYGTIEARHNPEGQGCLFTVTLPLGNAHLKNEQISDTDSKKEYVISEAVNEVPPADIIEEDDNTSSAGKKKTILVAEDSNDIRQYLRNEFSDKYNVILCSDGKSAYGRILSDMPQLVISDVVMPEMDGFHLCKKVRNNPIVSHIPFILLTARTLDQDNVEGMEAGADAYITKPFNITVLKQTVSNLLETREKLKVSFSESKIKESDIKGIEIKSPDDRLLERIVKVLNENISNPQLTVEDVAHEVGISRVHLHRKLKELTNQTSRDFIRNVRLKKAAEMLGEKKHSIAELSDAVGFSNPATFSTSFKDLYGVSPSEYRSAIERQQNEQ